MISESDRMGYYKQYVKWTVINVVFFAAFAASIIGCWACAVVLSDPAVAFAGGITVTSVFSLLGNTIFDNDELKFKSQYYKEKMSV